MILLSKGTVVADQGWSQFILTTDKTATIAQLMLKFSGQDYHAAGSSYRVRGDKYSEDKGNLLAVLRAVRQLESILADELRNLAD